MARMLCIRAAKRNQKNTGKNPPKARIGLSWGANAPSFPPMSPALTQVSGEGVRRIAILRADGDGPAAREDAVAVEEPLEIQLSFERRGIRTTKSVSVTMR